MEDPDAPVVRAVQAGDTESFRLLIERHQGRLLSVLRRTVRDEQQAEELAEETFVKAYLGLKGFRGEARFGTWLLQIALHAARDRRRSERRSRVTSLEQLLESADDNLPRDDLALLIDSSPGADPADALDRADVALRLEAGLARLPDEYREVFVLKHMQDLSYEEIAAVTGDSVGTLKVRAHRARQKLRRWIELPDALPSSN